MFPFRLVSTVNGEKVAVARPRGAWRKSKFTTAKSPVYVSDNMTAKMEGVPVIGTSYKNNRFCAMHKDNNPDNVCNYCFAEGTLEHYKSIHNALTENEFLKVRLLAPDEIPVFKGSVEIVRFESFGDIETAVQVANYFAIAKANKHIKFALWTKNPVIVWNAFKLYGLKKLANMTLVYSSPLINRECKCPPFFDHVFTVYRPDFIQANDTVINCGARSCLTCKRCYTRKTSVYVREQLK